MLQKYETTTLVQLHNRTKILIQPRNCVQFCRALSITFRNFCNDTLTQLHVTFAIFWLEPSKFPPTSVLTKFKTFLWSLSWEFGFKSRLSCNSQSCDGILFKWTVHKDILTTRECGEGIMSTIYMGYWPSVRSADYWPSSFFTCLWTWTESRSINTQEKKNLVTIQPFWQDKLGQYRIYCMEKEHCFVAGHSR